MKNWTKFEGKIFPSHICPKLDSYWQKTCSWCQLNFKFGTQANHVMPRKKAQNNFFNWGQDHCENGIWNEQIFFIVYDGVLRPVFNSSPQFHSHLSCCLLQLKLTQLQILHLQLTVFNSYPNIYQKWNWKEDDLQIFCLK